MADDLMSEERWQAGADYLASLRSLGFEPDALLWAQKNDTGEMVLVIISPIVDRVGSTEIYDALFKAYDHAITPKSIDPWIVSVFGPGSIMSGTFDQIMQVGHYISYDGGKTKLKDGISFDVADKEYTFFLTWVYAARNTNMERRRQDWMWRKFSGNVDRLAA